MSRSLNQPKPLDWRTLLLEAIQQRDASRAIVLAQRCVHRQGMATLERLLDQAAAAEGQDGEARTWLLHLLSQGVPPSEAPPSPPEPLSPSPHPLAMESQPSQLPDTEAPSTDQVDPDPRSIQTAPPASASGPVAASVAAPLSPSAPDPAFATAALDQAFAPLEIAFPPLPQIDRRESLGPAPAKLDPVPPPSFSVSEAKESRSSLVAAPLEEKGEVRAEALQGPEPVSDDPRPLLDDLEAGAAAAPVPSFHVDSPIAREPVSLTSSLLPDPAAEAPPPGRNVLESWRAWLPGAFRSRKRS